MTKILIVGGSRGIGSVVLKNLVQDNEIINFSRTAPETQHKNLLHYTIDILKDDLPELEGISKIIYCPGSITLKPINSLKEEDFLYDYQINVIGAFKTIKKYARQVKKQEGASIVLFSTVASKLGMPFHSSIAAAKAGVEALTKSLAAELSPKIRVNCIAPSVTQTPLAQNLLRNEKAIDNIINRHPLKILLQADDIANMAIFLLSDKSRGITGQIMAVDAGLSTLKL